MLSAAGINWDGHVLQVAKVHTDLAYHLREDVDGHTVAFVDADGNIEIFYFRGRDTLRQARAHINRRKRGEA